MLPPLSFSLLCSDLVLYTTNEIVVSYVEFVSGMCIMPVDPRKKDHPPNASFCIFLSFLTLKRERSGPSTSPAPRAHLVLFRVET